MRHQKRKKEKKANVLEKCGNFVVSLLTKMSNDFETKVIQAVCSTGENNAPGATNLTLQKAAVIEEEESWFGLEPLMMDRYGEPSTRFESDQSRTEIPR
ncbi:hypothetical protein CEXT_419361 [Caerostris extrusa]|uniref:Uncharacterized protein n=1 Tax=Caerostris extrusa TaxID=172846 RepID=A0AAV4NEG9_CAEEX|nr:hypothetical protein CEXT_419361 [Caerostris extrusa]